MATRAAARSLLVDIHTHTYLPRYAALLRARSTAPRILSRPKQGSKDVLEERLVILDNEPSGGRPVGPQYWDREQKLAFMDKHGIDVSVVSTANPWLDFLPPDTASTLARELNDDLESYCATSPTFTATAATSHQMKRLYALGLLPLVPSVPIASVLSAIDQIATLPHLRGVIVGTRGLGKGLDDAALEPVWQKLAANSLVVFIHPHYGVGGADAWGERDNGHVLPLALGFPFETTTAITRLILAGVLDRHPSLKLLLAHSGGTLPQLSSRLASCITHDPAVAARLQHDARWYLGRLWFDAVCYGPEELEFVASAIGRASRYAESDKIKPGDQTLVAAERKDGSKRLLWGTDHPFFPPIGEGAQDEKWMSVMENLEAVDAVGPWGAEEKDGVRGGNAIELFGLDK
ncbi:hypothetical protein BOTBODRAFT_156094 [Botryobasidium botryosum FD-172 SS1]|uniref:Amidohydrolase-related domain-containing protein n=1 Tax=Botryobasidium botryosum (strain FD-172 SS1) TaxID=930990 RepID=A0A067MP82_BOTB1|nr:hypothetical protein BOTBODRAFT_156094 [Botryobasidium botryosum FD-172 SS1]